jgi:Flp/Fap pilin component
MCRATISTVDQTAHPGIVPRNSGFLNQDQSCFRDPVLQLFIEAGNLLRMITLVRKFWADETGATAIEYGLIAAGIWPSSQR